MRDNCLQVNGFWLTSGSWFTHTKNNLNTTRKKCQNWDRKSKSWMISNIPCWMKSSTTADCWVQKMMTEKDMPWTMKTVGKVWSWKSKSSENKFSWSEKKEPDTMNFWETINSPNKKNNWLSKNSGSTTSKPLATIWEPILVSIKKRPNAVKSISWLKTKNTWPNKTFNWSKKTEDFKIDWTGFNNNFSAKKTDHKSTCTNYLT